MNIARAWCLAVVSLVVCNSVSDVKAVLCHQFFFHGLLLSLIPYLGFCISSYLRLWRPFFQQGGTQVPSILGT